MTFNGTMEPGPWYFDGVEVNVEDVPEDDILHEVTVRANHNSIAIDPRNNFAVPSHQFSRWLAERGWDNETVRMSPQVSRDPNMPFFEVTIMFENKRAAQLFQLVWL